MYGANVKTDCLSLKSGWKLEGKAYINMKYIQISLYVVVEKRLINDPLRIFIAF
jgi:hypothetical protein